jgi:hypothetical protein
LSVLAPVAIGHSIDKKTKLWNDYKKARKIRNKIVHSGTRVSVEDARFVIDTVYDWLAYLGSRIGLELSLLRLKSYVETNKITVSSEQAAVSLVREYFGHGHEKTFEQKDFPDGRTYFALKIGRVNTWVSIKLVDRVELDEKGTPSVFEKSCTMLAAPQLSKSEFSQGALIAFVHGELQERYDNRIVSLPILRPRLFKWLHLVVIECR